MLFDGHLLSAWAVTARVIGALSVPFPARISLIVRHKPVMIRTGYSAAFFDGAAIVGGTNCGAGGTILCSDSLVYRWFLNCGEGSNTKAELLGAWGTLTLAKLLDLQLIQLMGDSKVVIDWLDQKGRLQVVSIEAWKRCIKELIPTFQRIHFHHIFRESNRVADQMSKIALSAVKGRLTYFSWDGEKDGPNLTVDYF